MDSFKQLFAFSESKLNNLKIKTKVNSIYCRTTMQKDDHIIQQFKVATKLRNVFKDNGRTKTESDESKIIIRTRSYKKFQTSRKRVDPSLQQFEANLNNDNLKKLEADTSDIPQYESYKNCIIGHYPENEGKSHIKKTKSLCSIAFIGEFSSKQITNNKNQKINEKRYRKFNLKKKATESEGNESRTESQSIYNEFTLPQHLNMIAEIAQDQEQQNGRKFKKLCSNCEKNIELKHLCRVLIENIRGWVQKLRQEQGIMITEFLRYKESILSEIKKDADAIQKQNLLVKNTHKFEESIDSSMKLQVNQFVKQISDDIEKLMTKLVNEEDVIKRLHIGKIVKNKPSLVHPSYPLHQPFTVIDLNQNLGCSDIKPNKENMSQSLMNQNFGNATTNYSGVEFAQKHLQVQDKV